MADTFALDTLHNFGIYNKSGKRTIFQIDFSSQCINLIERGNIKRRVNFRQITQYDSEDNLHLIIRLQGAKGLEFDADTAEEKYTICRLLSIILGDDESESIRPDQNGGDEDRLLRTQRSSGKQVIKEGVLDKKGNTTIPTWSRRRLQVCPGEFSYYKPGDEVALNLVQLWENVTSVYRAGSNGFTVAVKDRNYHFRVLADKGTLNVKQERDRWIEAFIQASHRKRTTLLLLEMSQGGVGAYNTEPLEEEEDPFYFYPEPTKSVGGSTSSSDSLGPNLSPEFQAIHQLDEVINIEIEGNSRPQRAVHTENDIDLNVIMKDGPLLDSPTQHRPRPPAQASGRMQNGRQHLDSTEEQNAITIHANYPTPSPPSSRADIAHNPPRQTGYGDVPRDASAMTPLSREAQSSGKYTRVIGVSAGGSADSINRSSGDYETVIKPAGAVDVMPRFVEIPQLRKVGSDTRDAQIKSNEDGNAQSKFSKDNATVKQIQQQFERQGKDTPASARDPAVSPSSSARVPAVSPPKKMAPPAPNMILAPSAANRQQPRVPTVTQSPKSPDIVTSQLRPPQFPAAPPQSISPVPPPPMSHVPPPPVPPPPLPDRSPSRGRLKQVHWSRVPKPLIQNSIWERPRDLSTTINISLLMEQFTLKERDITATGLKAGGGNKPQLLIEPKRAQNLGIFMSGLKNNGIRMLMEALNSVKENDAFPSEKLSTIRRYQPTEDEQDMYRDYVNKKHQLHAVDQFMLELCLIPCLAMRIDICLTIWDFPWQYDGTRQLIDQVHGACDELLSSEMFVRVLEYLLAIGNSLNSGWAGPSAGFQLSSIEKFTDVRGKDAGYTLVHFLVDQIRMSEPALLRWPETVQTVRKCEQASVKAVVAETEVLKGDLSKAKKHLKILKSKLTNVTQQDHKFQQDAQNLTIEYEMDLEKLNRRCAELHHKYRKLLTRFGEPVHQRSDNLFAMVSTFAERFSAAVKDVENRTLERKTSNS